MNVVEEVMLPDLFSFWAFDEVVVIAAVLVYFRAPPDWTAGVSALVGSGRARIVLLAADGLTRHGDFRAGRGLAFDRRQLAERSTASGAGGVEDARRSGRPREHGHSSIVEVTLKPPRKKYGVMQWSRQLLPPRLGISDGTGANVWRA